MSVNWELMPSLAMVLFSGDLNESNRPASHWSLRFGGYRFALDDIEPSGDGAAVICLSPSPEAGPNQVTYDGLDPEFLDAVGRRIAPFTIGD